MTDRTKSAAGIVLLTLASGQFLMTLDSSVMNVSIAQVAEDVGTTVTGIQTAITLYTLVMATLMITGGKIGSLIGRKRGVHDRLCHLWRGLADHFACANFDRPHHWLVLPGGHRGGADHAGDRGAGRLEFRSRGATACLWPRGVGRRHRGCRRVR